MFEFLKGIFISEKENNEKFTENKYSTNPFVKQTNKTYVWLEKSFTLKQNFKK